jgi:adenosylmethionine-8-amino-7-oxononanoate aminotransferase
VFENSDPAEGGIYHGYTYSAHPVGAAAVAACLAETVRLDLRANAAARGTQLYEGLQALASKHDIIGNVRGGQGLMTGMELVSDKSAKTPIDPATVKRIQQATYEAGAMVRMGPPNILMSPPLTISESEVQTILTALDSGLSAA